MEFALSELSNQVMTARAASRPVFIRGGGTKSFYGEIDGLEDINSYSVLDMSTYQGIVNYQPSELVITVKAGTLLSDIERTLNEQNQMLAFEPPRFGAGSTVGGCVAAGLSGPRRMAAGSLRDFILGTRLLDSTGVALRFGGEVMKNVAGYDVSRLLAGSMGIFGALLEVSIKVMPRPFREETRVLDVDQAGALAFFGQWRGQPLPISATAWHAGPDHPDGRLWVRLSGSEPAVASAIKKIGGQAMTALEAASFWDSLRDQTHPFFKTLPMWRVAVPPQTPPLDLGPTLIEWNGGQRWLANPDSGADLRSPVARAGGHATLFRYASKAADVPAFHPPGVGLMNIFWRLKHQLDPLGIFNPKRLFPEF